MKKALLFISSCCIALSSIGQTATNFNLNDCSGNNHDLYSELNSNKVIVLFWVMPCAQCIGPALTAYNAVQGYQSSNPNTVYFYLVDDYGNTTCTSLSSWASTNGMTSCEKFSSSAIDMNDYGGFSMQKCVVLGGNSHSTYFNGGGTAITTAAVQGGINSALAAIAAGVKENTEITSNIKLSPNPANNSLTLSFSSKEAKDINLEIYNITGQKVRTNTFTCVAGENSQKIETSELSNGTYFIKLNGQGSIKVLVAH